MPVEIISLLSLCNSRLFCGGTAWHWRTAQKWYFCHPADWRCQDQKKKICYCCPNYLVNGLSGVNVLDLCFSHGWFCKNNQPAAELMQQIMSQLHRHHQIRVTKNKALVLFFCISFIKWSFKLLLIFWFWILNLISKILMIRGPFTSSDQTRDGDCYKQYTNM